MVQNGISCYNVDKQVFCLLKFCFTTIYSMEIHVESPNNKRCMNKLNKYLAYAVH